MPWVYGDVAGDCLMWPDCLVWMSSWLLGDWLFDVAGDWLMSLVTVCCGWWLSVCCGRLLRVDEALGAWWLTDYCWRPWVLGDYSIIAGSLESLVTDWLLLEALSTWGLTVWLLLEALSPWGLTDYCWRPWVLAATEWLVIAGGLECLLSEWLTDVSGGLKCLPRQSVWCAWRSRVLAD